MVKVPRRKYGIIDAKIRKAIMKTDLKELNQSSLTQQYCRKCDTPLAMGMMDELCPSCRAKHGGPIPHGRFW